MTITAVAPRRIVLVACAAGKQRSDAPARDLYTSVLFRKARAWAEAHGDEWRILSALHGLVAPDHVLAPYDLALADLDRAARHAWAHRVLGDLRATLHLGDTVVFLAGRLYRADLAPALAADGHRIDVPMEGLGIGQQLAWLTRPSR